MAVTQADIDALQKAMVSGALKVRYPDGSEVTYRSMEEMRQAFAQAQAAIAPQSVPASRLVVARW